MASLQLLCLLLSLSLVTSLRFPQRSTNTAASSSWLDRYKAIKRDSDAMFKPAYGFGKRSGLGNMVPFKHNQSLILYKGAPRRPVTQEFYDPHEDIDDEDETIIFLV